MPPLFPFCAALKTPFPDCGCQQQQQLSQKREPVACSVLADLLLAPVQGVQLGVSLLLLFIAFVLCVPVVVGWRHSVSLIVPGASFIAFFSVWVVWHQQ